MKILNKKKLLRERIESDVEIQEFFRRHGIAVVFEIDDKKRYLNNNELRNLRVSLMDVKTGNKYFYVANQQEISVVGINIDSCLDKLAFELNGVDISFEGSSTITCICFDY